MIASREAFLSRGHFSPFVETVTDRVIDAIDRLDPDGSAAQAPTILEVGAGTGYYLAHTLDSIEDARGVGIDIAVPAAKLLAKAHPRLGAVVADVWDGLPIRDESIDAITVIFAPRNPAEFARVLRPGGEVIVVTPQQGHLDELREPLGILGVEPGKMERMVEQAQEYLRLDGEPEVMNIPMQLDRESIAAQVGMSPSARHIEPETLRDRVEALPSTLSVTARAHLTRFRKA
ncbi:23S rRNA (guanine(748)-N(1))-methyltransferase [Corynebacterium aquatimens]|uniref:23S rRNA (Guanine745-N1)-methyltransferase n=1 Tax=Corynebacterium aquatimens TaxID=1190508 RepID=A0A931GSX3_9CORY|nr:23S rRNA (guanine745-N1)-methyltransferase [Corynebacterium aquatimens]WJY66160.1 23S rRNA (guanine(748)-N(1))-methyltransferase [Corynebacterium aquatimens]